MSENSKCPSSGKPYDPHGFSMDGSQVVCSHHRCWREWKPDETGVYPEHEPLNVPDEQTITQ